MQNDIESIMHHRKQPSRVVAKNEAVESNRLSKEEKRPHSGMPFRTPLLWILSMGAAFYVSYQFLSWYSFLKCWTLLPVVLCGYQALRRRSLIAAAVVLAVGSAQLPTSVAALVAALAVLAFSLSTKQTTAVSSAQQQSFATVVAAIAVMIAVLLTENFFIWVVSATFLPGQNVNTAPPPLQDNGQLLVQSFFTSLSRIQVVQLRRLWNTQWALVAALGASFVQVEVWSAPSHRSLYGIGTRAVLTVAAARAIRTASFLLTVLPSQVRHCYGQRFPVPPPTELWSWIWVGILPRTHGGCNDLIISGHAVITSTMACVSTSVAEDPLFALSLWSMLILDYAIEIYEGFHYSVDMWLGMVLVALLWQVLAPLEGTASKPPPPPMVAPSRSTVLLYLPPAAIAYLQLTLLPMSTANLLIVFYAVVAIGVYFYGSGVLRKSGDDGTSSSSRRVACTHYAQHILLCLLFMALGIYL